MDVVQSIDRCKGFRSGFFSTLNRSFRLSGSKSRNASPSPVGSTSLGSALDMATSAGLSSSNDASMSMRPLEIVAPRIDTYRFSMANLEETQDADLDAILGELCALDSEYDEELCRVSSNYGTTTNNANSTNDNCVTKTECHNHNKECSSTTVGITRTDSPDNDSAFSDTVSMLSSESSASSSASSKCKALKLNLQQTQKDANFQQKADKIKLALERMREANVKKLFIKAFSMDGSSKSLLVDEKMTSGYVTRLLADKNHVNMEPKWAIVEHLPDLHMERVYEDHEILVDNLMLWTRESKNKILFAERQDKIQLFQTPEKFLLSEDDRGWSSEHDEHSRQVIIEEFFGQSGVAPSTVPSLVGHPVPPMEGHLYLKNDSRKGWKQYFFVLRPSGLYYSPKEKTRTLKELTCLATFDTNEVYMGVNWRKKYKSPTDHCFAIKHPKLQQPKSVKFIKFLCADDQQTLLRWVTAIRIAKHGRQLMENYRALVEELTQEDLDHLAHARSCSITSIPTKTNGAAVASMNSPAQSSSSNASVANSDISSGRHSRASSSSSSGCMSDGGTASESGFDCEFPMGTIKRKPSMKPNIPLTWMTRQLKEMVEKGQQVCEEEEEYAAGDGGTLTRRNRHSSTDDSTLKRHHALVAEPVNSVYGTTAAPAAFAQYDAASSLYASVEELPPPPPPEDVPAFGSTLSLESLPPPPPPDHMLASQLSLPPPPPPPLRQPSLDSVASSAASQAYGACLVELQAKKLSNGGTVPKETRTGSIKKVNFADEVDTEMRKSKKISFNLPPECAPPSPRKPPPPKRNESTRLSSPKKLADSSSNPPKEFLKDLQRVMRKKWQVAQKCKLEPATTPHEVLGFREWPLSEEYKEASVSMWVQDHWGAVDDGGRHKRRPPAPPRRSDSTQLSTAAPHAAA